MQVKSPRSESGIRRRRVGRIRPFSGREQPLAAPAPAHRRRELGPPEDQALYHCHCGFVFEAPVSTSVGCPHCGGQQAW
jgi:hypothetical protein